MKLMCNILPSSGEEWCPRIQPRYTEPHGGFVRLVCDGVQLCGIIALVVLL